MHISHRSVIGVISTIAVSMALVWILRDDIGNFAAVNSKHPGDSDSPHGTIEFNRDIRPILNRSCTGCHGGVKKNAGVSFIERSEVLALSSEGNPIIVPGDPWNSEVVKRITAKDPQIVMPPAGGEHQHDPLSQDEIDKIIEWIRQGAIWQDHWAYLPPKDIAVEVQNQDWIRQALDRHVLARLEALGLTPTAEAPKAQWLRRASLDLTGLPPTPEELDAFLADTSPDAYESCVDRLLESPRYGERWAAMWMDLARYADTYGFEKDPHRNSWPYRQWLIESFNRDMPYTKFVSDQIAGDLADQADVNQWIATLFQRMTKTNTEGGTDDEQFRVEAVMDRISTTWQVFQGITMGCVQCHDHPYEPIPHEDYYHSMYYFNNNEDCDLDNDFPHMLLADETGARQSTMENQQKLSQLRQQRNQRGAQWIDRDPTWFQPAVDRFEISAGELVYTDGVFHTKGTQPPQTHYRIHLHAPSDASLVTALKITILPDDSDPAKSPFRGSVLSQLELHHVSADGTSSPLPVSWVYADALAGPHFPEDSLQSSVAGFGAYPKLFGQRNAVFVLEKPTAISTKDRLLVILNCKAETTGGQATVLRNFQVHFSSDPCWQACVSDPEHHKLSEAIAEAANQLLANRGIWVPIMRERPAELRRATRLFIGGNPMNRGKELGPGVPDVLNRYQAPARNRSEMASWLTHPENPLLARVFVNRIFAELFGAGIVRTLGDFGTTGLPPENPQLLDHLAVTFRDDCEWRLKPLLRQLVLSATYRQDHRATPELAVRDPHNLLLARGPRTRLSAEMIRDHALQVSGLLAHRDAKGPSVMPPQPDGIWSQGAYGASNWKNAEGPDRFRRAIYTYWKRTAPYPSLLTFDAPNREVCSTQRITTNTPLQPLVTLNDPAYIEMARGLAKRMLEFPDAELSQQISWGHRLVTQQDPSEHALHVLCELHGELLKQYSDNKLPPHSKSAPEAAMTEIASALLNLDLALSK